MGESGDAGTSAGLVVFEKQVFDDAAGVVHTKQEHGFVADVAGEYGAKLRRGLMAMRWAFIVLPAPRPWR